MTAISSAKKIQSPIPVFYERTQLTKLLLVAECGLVMESREDLANRQMTQVSTDVMV